MCTNPISIKNPLKGSHIDSQFPWMDCTSSYISVPCGHCDECVKVRQMSFVQRVQMEALENHIFFCTLTYNNDSLPYVYSSVINPVTGEPWRYRFADRRDFNLMIKRIRNGNLFGSPFRFVAVSELGGLRGRPHFHCLFFIPKRVGDSLNDCLNLEYKLFNVVLYQWKRNYGSRRSPVYRPLCDFVRKFVNGKLKTTFDLHFVNPNLTDGSEGDVAFYVSKYMIKPSKRVSDLQSALRLNLDDEEYKRIWSVVKPCWFSSNLFGLNGKYVSHNVFEPSKVVIDYIRSCVARSRESFDCPKFINPLDGKSFPLSRYYLNRLDCVSLDDHKFFYDKSCFHDEFAPLHLDSRNRSAVIQSINTSASAKLRLDFDFDALDDLF